MDRLTVPDVRVDEHTIRRTFIDVKAVREHVMEFYWRLKDYEDTGLTPDEIAAMRHTLDEYHKTADPLLLAKAQGRVVVLPVAPVLTPAISSLLYVIEDGEIYEDALCESVVCMSSSGETNVIYTTLSDQMIFEQADIGKTVFLTREEAERALRKGITE